MIPYNFVSNIIHRNGCCGTSIFDEKNDMLT